MKLTRITILSILSAFVCGFVSAQNIHITTPNNSLVLSANKGAELQQVYYGAKLGAADFDNIDAVSGMHESAYPAYGLNCPGDFALAVRHADGNMTTQLGIRGVETMTDGNAK